MKLKSSVHWNRNKHSTLYLHLTDLIWESKPTLRCPTFRFGVPPRFQNGVLPLCSALLRQCWVVYRIASGFAEDAHCSLSDLERFAHTVLYVKWTSPPQSPIPLDHFKQDLKDLTFTSWLPIFFCTVSFIIIWYLVDLLPPSTLSEGVLQSYWFILH